MSKFCVKRPFTVLVAVIMVLVLGFVSLTGMQTDLLPDFSLPYLVVITTYPGASPERVESSVTEPLESALGTISGVENVTSTSAENYSMVMLEFVEDMDMDSAMVKVSSALDEVESTLPDLCSTPSIMEVSMDMMATMYVTVTYDGMDIYDVSEFTEDTVIPYLERQSGVASITDIGLVEQTVQISLDQSKIDELNDQLLVQVSDRLAEAKAELEDAKKELEDGQEELTQTQTETAEGLGQATEAMTQLAAYQSQLTSQQAQLTALQTARSAVVDQLAQNGQSVDDLDDTLSTLQLTTSLMQLTYDALIEFGCTDETQLISLQDIQDAADEAAQQVEDAAAQASDFIEEALPGETFTVESDVDGVSVVSAESGVGPAAAAGVSAAGDEVSEKLPELAVSITELLGDGLETVGDLKTYIDTMNTAADGLQQAQTALEQFDSEITALTVEIQVTQAIIDGYQSALGDTSFTDVTSGSIAAAAGFGSADAQLTMGQSQLESAQEEYDAAREEALESANLDQLLSIDTLSQLIYAQNFSMPAGYIDAEDDEQWLLKVGEEFESVEDLENMLLCSVDGIGDVRIKDVAEVTLIDNTEDSYARMNGEDAVILSIFKGSTSGTSEVSKACGEAIEELEETYPGLHISTLMDQGDYIELIVHSLFSNLIEGALLAVIVLILFLKAFKPTLVVAFSIPFSVLFAVVLMYFSDISLNMLSLSGLALAVGMLVDNSVVVVENIDRLRARGIAPGRAAVQGAKQVSGAIISSTVTTVCVFLPLVFASGLVRELLGDMGLTIAYALAASLVVALTVVPTMSAFLMKNRKERSHKLFEKMLDGYEKAVRFCLRFKVVPIAISVVLLAFSVYEITRLGIVLLPDTSVNQVSVTVTMPEELTREEAYARADELLDRMLTVDGVVDCGGMTTSTMSSFVSTASTGSDDYLGYTYYIMLEDDASVTQVCEDITAATADIDCELTAEGAASMDLTSLMSSGLEVDIYGQDLDELVSVSEDVMELVEGIDGFTDISNGQEEGDIVVQLDIDKDEAMKQGLTVAQIYAELSSAMTTETTSTSVEIDGTTMSVQVENKNDPLALANLMDYTFDTTTTDEDGNQVDGTVKLSEIAEVSYTNGVASISRENQTRTMSVTATTMDGYNTTLLSRQLNDLLEDYDCPKGVTISLGGETDTVNDMVVQMVKMIALAILFIYLVMVAQFQSLLSPFIVLFTMPLAFTGGLIGLLITGEQLSMVSLMGFLVLAGVVVNNGIVFVDYVNQLRLGGLDRRTALVATGRTRMRPILMTTLTTICSMLLMVFDNSAGSQMGKGMAIVVIGGLGYATLMTLFVVPVLYDVMYRKQVTNIDVGEDDLDDLPDDAAEFAEQFHSELERPEGADETPEDI